MPRAGRRRESSTASETRRRWPLFRPGDVLLAVSLAVLAAIFVRGRGDGAPDTLRACSPSGEIAIALPADTLLSVQGRLGPVLIEVSGCSARVSDSPCPGVHCVRQSWISSSGEVVVCAPSGVWIRLEGGDEPDAVSY